MCVSVYKSYMRVYKVYLTCTGRYKGVYTVGIGDYKVYMGVYKVVYIGGM